MKKKELKPITLKAEDIHTLYDYREEDPENREEVPGFEGWSIDCDKETGKYDSAKGSVYDYKIFLYNKKFDLVGVAIGGYFNGTCGHEFNYDLTFYPPETETPKSKFNDFLSDLSESDDSIKKKIAKIKKYIEKLENA